MHYSQLDEYSEDYIDVSQELERRREEEIEEVTPIRECVQCVHCGCDISSRKGVECPRCFYGVNKDMLNKKARDKYQIKIKRR